MENTKTNKELESFLKNDYDFSEYVNNRTDDSSDLNDIYNAITSGNFDKIPEEKMVMKKFLKSPDSDIQEIISMGKSNESVLRYASAKILLKCYDKMIQGGMQNHHKMEQKPEENRTPDEQKALNRMDFKVGIEISKIMNNTDLKDEFKTIVDIVKTSKEANDGDGQPSPIPLDTMINIAKDSKSRIAKILAMAGKFQGTFAHKINTKSDGYNSVIGVEFGDDLNNVLPEEIAMLDDLELGEIKAIDMIQGNLMQYKYIGKKPMTDGPIVCCIDESGSMDGERIIIAKAYCYGLYQQAKAENRNFTIIRFGRINHAEVHEINSFQDMINVSEAFFNDGGTDFETPLKKSMEIITGATNQRDSDIVFITDGADSISSTFIEQFKSFKNSTQTKLIVMDITGRVNHYGNLREIASVVVNDYETLVYQS